MKVLGVMRKKTISFFFKWMGYSLGGREGIRG